MMEFFQTYWMLGLVVLGFGVIILIAEALKRIWKIESELSRKLVHTCGGLLCLAFPWVVDSPWPILVIAVFMCALFILTHRLKLLKGVHGIERKTHGSEFFPISIFLAFYIAGDQTWIYVCAIITLAVADAGAALIGSRYGRWHYEVESKKKSIEGSMVFMMCAFLAIHLPVLLMTDLPRESTVLIALLLAILLTMLEAVSLDGWDNLIIPVAVCEILKRISTKPVEEIAFQTLSLIMLIVIMAIMARRVKGLNVGGAMAFILFTYACWSLGKYTWALPVLLALAIHAFIWQLKLYHEELFNHIRVRFIVRCCAVPFLVLLVANITRGFDHYFLVFFCAMMTTLLTSLLPSDLARVRGWTFTSLYMLIMFTVCGTLYAGLLWALGWDVWSIIACVSVAVVISFIGFFVTPRAKDITPESIWPVHRMVYVAVAVAILLTLQVWGFLPALSQHEASLLPKHHSSVLFPQTAPAELIP